MFEDNGIFDVIIGAGNTNNTINISIITANNIFDNGNNDDNNSTNTTIIAGIN